MMQLDWLGAFRAVIQSGTVTGAAAIMLRTQPQVSRIIASLESDLRLRLFVREGCRLVPTEDGLQFFQYIEPLLLGLDGIRNTADDIKRRRGKPLVITAEPFLLHAPVPEAIQEMSRKSSLKCAIDICVRGRGLWASRSNVDLGIVALPFSQTDMVRIGFAQAELVLAVPVGHRLAKSKVVDMKELAGERFIALRPSTLLRAQIDIAAARAGISINPVIEAASGVTACQCVARGLGITIADPIVASSFASVGVAVRRMSAGLRLTYGYLVPKDGGETSQRVEIMQAVARAAERLGGDFVRINSSSMTKPDGVSRPG